MNPPFKGGFIFKQESQVYLAVLYCKLDKLEELNHVPFEWRLGRGSFNDDAVNFIVNVITDQYRTNGGLNIKLDKRERKKLYHWFSKYSYETSNYMDEYDVKDFHLATMYYIFSYDEDWQDFLTRVKNAKRLSVNSRISYIHDVFKYLISIDESSFVNLKDDKGWVMKIDVNNIKRINALLSVVKQWTYKKMELKKCAEELQWLGVNNSNQFILSKYIFESFCKIIPHGFKFHRYENDRWYGANLSEKLNKVLTEIV